MSRLRAYAELLRIPNVFTAMADICLGWFVTHGTPFTRYGLFSWLAFGLLLLSSSCFYCAGMVLNDYFDIEEDQRERPFRPIPSRRVSRRAAGRLGLGLLAFGLFFAAASGVTLGLEPFLAALPLAFCVILYDGWLKRTWAGPLGMGLCRFLNVLLGCSGARSWPALWMLGLASTVGIYTFGVTVLAGTETTNTKRSRVVLALIVMLLSAFAAFFLAWRMARISVQTFAVAIMLLAAWMIIVLGPLREAVGKPEPSQVQASVKRCILGLIGLDAVLAFLLVGWPALVILLLLVPALLLGRWVYST